MPNLERLSLADLDQLNTLLQTLAAAGHVLLHRGLTPVFDLVPGTEPAILLPSLTMPYAYEADEDDSPLPPRDDAPYAWSPATGIVPIGNFDDIATTRRPGGMPPSPPAPSRDSAAAATTAVECPADDAPAAVAHDAAAGVAPEEITDPSDAAPPPAAEDGPAGEAAEATADAQPAAAEAPATHSEPAAPEQTAPPLADTRPEGDGAQADDGGGMAAAPAATQAAPIAPPSWTAAEDAQLVALTVEWLRQGLTRGEAMKNAAEAIGRPHEGAKYRLYSKLKDRLAEAEAAMQRVSAMADERPAGPLTPFGHLQALRTANPALDLAICADILRLAIVGMGIEDIAVELDLRAATVRSHFDMLTGLTRRDDGKQFRQFSREAVLATLEDMLPKAAE